ncbi:TPA: hypothetical protein DEP94_00480 [Candidatus Nomurabacteria bacterium]|nr:hypothetical protein [Candidatus Nomurabacteria bacterium]
MSGVIISMVFLALGWEYGETHADGIAMLLMASWCGLVADIGVFTIMLMMRAEKWPKAATWLDMLVGFVSLGNGIWIVLKILWPVYMGYNPHPIFFFFSALAILIGLNYGVDAMKLSRKKSPPSTAVSKTKEQVKALRLAWALMGLGIMSMVFVFSVIMAVGIGLKTGIVWKKEAVQFVLWTMNISGGFLFLTIIPGWLMRWPYNPTWMWSGISFAGLGGFLVSTDFLLLIYGSGIKGNGLFLAGIGMLPVAIVCLLKHVAIHQPAKIKTTTPSE